MNAISEFFENLMNNFCKSMYDGMFDVADKQFKGMFESLNGMIADSATYITQSPQGWNPTAFNFIRGIAENVCIPLAGCLITFVFCLELVHMIQENNQMHPITPERILFVLMKLGIFLFIASKSFDIVMGIYDIGSWAAIKVSTQAEGIGILDIDLSKLLPVPEGDQYNFALVFNMLINLILIFIARIVVFVLAAAIFVKVNLWYLELLMYTSVAPIPMSTFLNQEWGQIGNNYIRKIIAVCFEGFFMLVAFGLYSALVANLQFSSGEFTLKLFMTIGCGFALFFTLCKAGNISASVFNAH